MVVVAYALVYFFRCFLTTVVIISLKTYCINMLLNILLCYKVCIGTGCCFSSASVVFRTTVAVCDEFCNGALQSLFIKYIDH